MNRRSLFQFSSMGPASVGTKEIQIPLLKRKQLSKQFKQEQYEQMSRILDASFMPSRSNTTLYEKLCSKMESALPVIQPESNLFLAWNIINLLFIFYNFIEIPIIIMIASNDLSQRSVRYALFIIDICALTIFLIDLLFVRFRVAFYQNQQLQLRFKVIFERYIRTGLTIDVIAFLVFFFDFLFQGDGMYAKIIFYIKGYTFFAIDKQVGDKLMYNQYANAFYRFIRMVGLIFFLTSLQACIYFAIDYHYYCQKGFNFQNKYLWLTSSQVVVQSGQFLNIIQSFSWAGWYMFALYWAVQTTSSVGYGSITPRNPAQVLFCNILMLTTICIFVTFANTIIDIVDQLQQNNLRRQAKFLQINRFTISNEAPKITRKKIGFFFDCLIQSKYDDSEQFLYSLLSNNLRQQSTLTFKNFIFSNLKVINALTKDKDGNWNMFAKDLTPLLKVSYHSTDNYLQRMGNTSNFKLVFIHRGKVTAFNDAIDYKKDYRQWDFFGQRQFFFGGKNLTNIICRTFTKFYSFQQEQFFKVLKQYRECYQQCRQMIDQVKFNNKLALNFEIDCYNCDEYHIFQNCPIAILWRDKLPRIAKRENAPNQRSPYTRKTIGQVKAKKWKKDTLAIDKAYFSKRYFSYGNL